MSRMATFCPKLTLCWQASLATVLASSAPASLAATGDSPVEQQFSLVGTVTGGDSPSLRDSAVILDTVSGKTHVLAVGMCLPRSEPVCIKSISDKKVVVDHYGNELVIRTIDGAVPRDQAYGYEAPSAHVASPDQPYREPGPDQALEPYTENYDNSYREPFRPPYGDSRIPRGDSDLPYDADLDTVFPHEFEPPPH